MNTFDAYLPDGSGGSVTADYLGEGGLWAFTYYDATGEACLPLGRKFLTDRDKAMLAAEQFAELLVGLETGED